MRNQIYRLHDVEPRGAFLTPISEASEWNKKGFGIFCTVNDFNGPRVAKNLRRVNAWAIDMDAGTKEEQAARIEVGLTPSFVNETKRGFQVWWVAKDASPEYWNAIVLDRLVPFYGADKNARDLCRILRMPGFYHMKDPANPFLVTKVFEWNVTYTQDQMAAFYPDCFKEQRTEFVKKQATDLKDSSGFWERVWHLDCLDGLFKLSGTDHVFGETYSFVRNSNGKHNILVNDKNTSCFIDTDYRIGSLSGGGPTLFQWLCWLGHSKSKAAEILKTVFPELNS